MFHDGDLQTGISTAIQQSKLVACFVRDDEEESALWESDYLQDEHLKSLLSMRTVLLRLQAGSQSAGYLAAICPIPKTPTLVIIHNGLLKEYLTSGVAKDEFMRRIKTVLEDRETASPTMTTAEEISPQATIQATSVSDGASGSHDDGPDITDEATADSHGAEPPSSAMQDVLTERRIRLEAHKKEKDAADKAEKLSQAKARREALQGDAPEGSKKAADMKYALLQKKRQQEAREERARILKRVEDDKAERREREALRKEKARAARSDQPDPDERNEVTSSSLQRSSDSKATECAVQVRLFDGSTIRSRFPTKSTLRGDVRRWIDDKQQDGGVPYNFKQVLTPHPNRNIDISEEEESLQSLGLFPSATLILVPVKGYTSAYENDSQGIISRGLSTGYGMLSSGYGLVTGALGSIVGGSPQLPQQGTDASSSTTAPTGINVRTFGDQQGRSEDQQLYNGNALNFEPRPDDDKKD